MNRLLPGLIADGSRGQALDAHGHGSQGAGSSGESSRDGTAAALSSRRGNSLDVLIVGAGPAGTMAALVLAQAGARVRILDRARFPRDKLCGDTVNPGSLAILDDAGLGDAVRARACAVRGMLVTGGGAEIATTYPRGIAGAALPRSTFDLLLVERAVAAGAAFEDGARVDAPVVSESGRVTGVRMACSTRARRLDARVVIVADGRASRIASALGLAGFARAPRRWAFGAYFEGVEGLTASGEMHIRSDGYLGIAPLPAGIANVCVVYAAGAGRAAPSVNQHRAIADAIAGDPLMRERFAHARQVSPVRVMGPLAVDARGAGCPGALLAGDAAGFVDPMTGDGLRFALRGGHLAAEAALEELATGAPAHVALQEAREREFSGKWRLNRALRLLVGSPRAVGAAALIARRWSRPIEYLTCAAGDVHLVRRCAESA